MLIMNCSKFKTKRVATQLASVTVYLMVRAACGRLLG